jgi:hypothetical protein
VFIGDHRVAKLVVETELGEIFLRSLDGRMNPLFPHKDLFYPSARKAPSFRAVMDSAELVHIAGNR